MNWIRLHRRSALLLCLTLFLPLFIYFKTLLGLLGLGMEYVGERNRVEPRVARLQGLLAQESLLAEQSALADKQLHRLVFGADEAPSSLSARLQADVRQIFLEATLSVSNSQVMPLREGKPFDRVAVKLTANGSLAALDAALIGLAAYEPKLVIESMDTFPAVVSSRRAGEPGTQRLTVVMQLMVLRAVP